MMFADRSITARLALVAAVVTVLTACSTTRYKRLADEEVYEIIESKSIAVPGMTDDVSIETPPPFDWTELPVNTESQEFLGPEAAAEVGAYVLSLEKALEVAFIHSRQYRAQKEQLYLQALSLTLDRHDFDPIFSAGGSVEHTWTFSEESVTTKTPAQFQQSLDTLTGSAAQMFNQYASAVESAQNASKGGGGIDVDRERTLSGSTNIGASLLLKGGGQFAVNLTSNFFRFLTGTGSDSAASALIASFTQPLLQGAGRGVFAEFLTQSERNVLYQLRDFTQFRKDFAVEIASSYYNVLGNKDAVLNNYLGLQSTQRNYDRERAFMEEGLQTPGEVGRLEENLLRREEGVTASTFNYTRSLDNFKILLGLPTDAPIILDQTELTRLAEEQVFTPDFEEIEAIAIALAARLDLYTERDQIADSGRRIRVAANAFMPDLDLVVAAAVPSEDGNRFLSPDFDRQEWTAGLDLDLNLDRKAERNNYRRALIDFEVAKRNYTLSEDSIKLDVRNALRALEQAETNYEINLKSLELSERRVEEQELRSELNLGDVLDLIDAQNDLTAAQTALTDAIVAHRIALLEFYRDMGILYIKNNGQWEELSDV